MVLVCVIQDSDGELGAMDTGQSLVLPWAMLGSGVLR